MPMPYNVNKSLLIIDNMGICANVSTKHTYNTKSVCAGILHVEKRSVWIQRFPVFQKNFPGLIGNRIHCECVWQPQCFNSEEPLIETISVLTIKYPLGNIKYKVNSTNIENWRGMGQFSITALRWWQNMNLV